MASDPVTSWRIDGEAMETVTNFIFLGSKITADGNCNHEIKRCLLLRRKSMTNPRIKPRPPSLQVDSLPTELPGKPVTRMVMIKKTNANAGENCE